MVARCFMFAALIGSTVLGGQVVHDGSLGPSKTLTGPNFTIAPGDGRQVGANLFHSFSKLNLSAGESANFTGPTSVRNVLARVTDGVESSIDGTLRTSIAGANLFFMNPAGVVFGPNAALDVDGAFVVTTADVIKLADGGKFSGDTIANNTVLTSADPSAFGFLKAKPSPVVVFGDVNTATRALLVTKPQKTLSIVGGELAVALANVKAPDGRINVVSVDSPGDVTGDLVSPGAAPPNVDSFQRLGVISINFFTLIDITGDALGQLIVRGGSLRVDNQSAVFVSNIGAADAPSPAIDMVLRDRLDMDNGSSIATTSGGSGAGGDLRLFARVANLANADTSGNSTTSISAFAFDSGRGGNVEVHFRRLLMSGQSDLSAASGGAGDSGDLTVHASRIAIDGLSKLIISSPTFEANRSGALTVHADAIDVTGGGKISSEATIAGLPGALTLDVADTLTIRGDESAVSVNGPVDVPGAGALRIRAGRVVIEGRGRISTLTLLGSVARSVQIDTDELVMSDEARIQSSTIGDAGGGTIDIRARRIDLRSGADIFTSVSGAGRGGSIIVDADVIRMDTQSGISSIADSDGAGGSVSIRTRTLEFLGDAQISSATTGPGDAGSVDVLATESIRFAEAGSGINSPSAPLPGATVGGKGGSIGVVTRNLTIEDGASIRATTATTGDAGDINISAEQITLADVDVEGTPSGILSRSRGEFAGAGRGGQINVKANQLLIRDGAAVTSASFGPGDSGNVTIRANDLTLETGGQIAASADLASGGELNINASRDLSMTSDARITAAAAGLGGNIVINSGRSVQLRASTITAAAGEQGNISINAPDSVIVIDSTITAQAQGTGGAIRIDPELVVLNRSTINGLAGGQDVLVTIDAGNLLASTDSQILTDRGFFTVDTDLAQSLTGFDLGLRGAGARLQETCEVRATGEVSSFTTVGAGGISLDPARPAPVTTAPAATDPVDR